MCDSVCNCQMLCLVGSYNHAKTHQGVFWRLIMFGLLHRHTCRDDYRAVAIFRQGGGPKFPRWGGGGNKKPDCFVMNQDKSCPFSGLLGLKGGPWPLRPGLFVCPLFDNNFTNAITFNVFTFLS